jgi:endonuclease YncB( thermonuclease family)
MWMFLFCLTLILFPLAVLAANLSSKVIGVLDGDTIEVLHDQKTERVKLHGIDCPEKGQAFAQRAEQATSALVFGKEITLQTHGEDIYGRTIADVLLSDGTNVNQQLLKEGWCWWYEKHAPNDLALKRSEQEAKAAKRGLWADANPVPPWLYRRLESGAYP